jgi:hypothetical protein
MSERVTVYVDNDEWYPVWSAEPTKDDGSTPYGDPVEVDAETAARWARVFAEFAVVQTEIRAAAHAAGHYGPHAT